MSRQKSFTKKMKTFSENLMEKLGFREGMKLFIEMNESSKTTKFINDMTPIMFGTTEIDEGGGGGGGHFGVQSPARAFERGQKDWLWAIGFLILILISLAILIFYLVKFNS